MTSDASRASAFLSRFFLSSPLTNMKFSWNVLIDGNSAFVGDEDGFLVGHFRFQNAEGRGQTHFFFLARVLRPKMSLASEVHLQEEINEKQLSILLRNFYWTFYSVMNLRMCEASATAFFNKTLLWHQRRFYDSSFKEKCFKLNESLLRMFCISQQRKRNSLFFHQLFASIRMSICDNLHSFLWYRNALFKQSSL